MNKKFKAVLIYLIGVVTIIMFALSIMIAYKTIKIINNNKHSEYEASAMITIGGKKYLQSDVESSITIMYQTMFNAETKDEALKAIEKCKKYMTEDAYNRLVEAYVFSNEKLSVVSSYVRYEKPSNNSKNIAKEFISIVINSESSSVSKEYLIEWNINNDGYVNNIVNWE